MEPKQFPGSYRRSDDPETLYGFEEPEDLLTLEPYLVERLPDDAEDVDRDGPEEK